MFDTRWSMIIHRTEDLVDHVKGLGLRTNIAVAAADDADAVKTIHEAWTRGILDATLVGPQARIRRIADELAVDVGRFRIVDAATDAECVQVCAALIRSGACDIVMKGRLRTADLISRCAAGHKGITGEVAGRADILLAHDINMGNAIYKALQVWVKVVFAGVVVGSKTPIVVPSRVDSPESKLQSIALAVLLMHRPTAAS